ncbi:hypothetical protein CerSpe_166910 [Prunus speciosa]
MLCELNVSFWVLDLSFLKKGTGLNEDGDCLVIGCSDNSVHLWDVTTSNVVLELLILNCREDPSVFNAVMG